MLALTLAAFAAQGAARAERRVQEPASPQPAPRPGAGQAPAAPGPSEPQQPPVFRTGINVVRVDVIVTDKQGNPVADLGPKDFDVLEDGKPQTIDTFKLVVGHGQPRAR